MSSGAGDPYLDPASGVLRNLLGITDAAELARAEAALSASRLIDLELRRLPGRYDLAHLEAFHRYILGDVYDWAGQPRTVSIAKGSVFCLPQHLESYAADVFGRLAAANRLRAWPGTPGSSLTSTPCTRSARATAAPSGRSSPSSPTTPAITSPGCAWTLTATRPPVPQPTTATWNRSAKCSTS